MAISKSEVDKTVICPLIIHKESSLSILSKGGEKNINSGFVDNSPLTSTETY
jgi:hypothetical protein